jgi:transposase
MKAVEELSPQVGTARDSSAISRGKAKSFPPVCKRRTVLWDCVDQLTLVKRQIQAAELQLIELLKRPRFQATAELLATFPGAGLVTIATVLAEVGDFQRFTHRKAIAR